MTTVKARDIKDLVRLLARAGARAEPYMKAALYQEALVIFAKSQMMTPVRFGILRSTGHVDQPTRAPEGGVQVIIGYGGPAAPYAMYVHEITRYKHDSPTSSKYLEKPVLQGVNGLLNRVAERADALMQS
jgi:hypothetical protein